MYAPMNLATNPTKEQRHQMLKALLENAGRAEDYPYIKELLSPPPDILTIAKPGKLKGIKVGIIGGGLAGMAAAFELRKLGADITLLEASEHRIGGRVYTYYFDPLGRYYGELGAHRIPVSHEASWHYIDLFNLDTRTLTPTNPNTFIYAHHTRLRITDPIEVALYPNFNLTRQERAMTWAELRHFAFMYPLMHCLLTSDQKYCVFSQTILLST